MKTILIIILTVSNKPINPNKIEELVESILSLLLPLPLLIVDPLAEFLLSTTLHYAELALVRSESVELLTASNVLAVVVAAPEFSALVVTVPTTLPYVIVAPYD